MVQKLLRVFNSRGYCNRRGLLTKKIRGGKSYFFGLGKRSQISDFGEKFQIWRKIFNFVEISNLENFSEKFTNWEKFFTLREKLVDR